MGTPSLRVKLLGSVSIRRDGRELSLPRSRKVRALLAFLALEPTPTSRSRLCDLLWDVPNDPRGELRWCLSKLRSVLDDAERKRVVTTPGSLLRLDLEGVVVDALEVDRAAAGGLERLSDERLGELIALVGGELLDGVAVDASAELDAWTAGWRRRLATASAAVLGAWASRAPPGSEERVARVDRWLVRAPLDLGANEAMIHALVACGRARDAEDHVTRAIRSFEQQGADWQPLRHVLERAKASHDVASAVHARVALVSAAPRDPEPRVSRRRSVAVMPFTDATGAAYGGHVDGLTDDVITRLAKLRVLFVIARGTMYALGERGVSAEDAARILGVDYVVSGVVRRKDTRVQVDIELVDARDARIVWTDRFEHAADETFSFLDALVNRIVAAIAEEIESEECKRAVLKPPTSLDAWEAYHRGLWHMYKFTAADNAVAAKLFGAAMERDPTFARPWAGLSFTHFQNVFLNLSPDRDREIALATETAAQSLSADGRDPAAHWAMGRALWLRGAIPESVSALERCVELSPNFALGHYTLGFVEAQSGDPRAAIAASTTSRELSPFDPLQFGMLASRALAHLRLGELEEGADWAVKAAGRPNAHAHILAIAASSLALASRRDEARELVARTRAKVPGYGIDDLLRSFRFDRDAEALLRKAARTIGFV